MKGAMAVGNLSFRGVVWTCPGGPAGAKQNRSAGGGMEVEQESGVVIVPMVLVMGVEGEARASNAPPYPRRLSRLLATV